MSTATPPPTGQPVNRLGLLKADYDGSKTTLCPGCGHNAITGGIIQAAWEAGLEPHRVAKLSGIGCSSKTPAYFLGHSHGFNSVHGRMPSIATGVHTANRELLLIGVSGDGDTASIGLGQFCHLVRRNVPVVYLVENNGVYGLTKGQFSATADVGSTQKGGKANPLMPIDLCALAIELGRPEAAAPAAQGGVRASGHRGHRRHQPVRDLRRPRGQHQELRGGEGARRAAA
jgi:2-oxoglutarate ferredoxin oxidoreductase subunit beta